MGLQWMFYEFGRMWLNLQDQAAAARRVFFYMDLVTDEEEHKPGNELGPIRQGVKIEKASLEYPNGHEALTDINLELNIGEVVAIVGPTGSGKTSLAYLLPASNPHLGVC